MSVTPVSVELREMFVGVGFVELAWLEAQRTTFQSNYPWPRGLVHPDVCSARTKRCPHCEYHRLLGGAEIGLRHARAMTIATTIKVTSGVIRPYSASPVRTWRWPEYVLTVKDLLRITSQGFELVTTYAGVYRDRPVYAFRRDGENSPIGLVNRTSAEIVMAQYCEPITELPDGTLLHKRKPQA